MAGRFVKPRRLLSALAGVLLLGAAAAPTQAFWWGGPEPSQFLGPWGVPWGPPGPPPSGWPGDTPGGWPPLDPVTVQLGAAGLQWQALAALNAGNAAGAAAYFADDGSYWFSDGIGACSVTPCVGRAAIQAELERQAALHAWFRPFELLASGNTVLSRWAIGSDRVLEAGAQRILGTIITETRGDRISSMRITVYRDDPESAKFVEWVARNQGVAAPSVATTTTPVATTPAAATAMPATTPLPAATPVPATSPVPAATAALPTPAAPVPSPAATAAPAAATGPSATANLAAQLNSGVTGRANLVQSGETTTVTVTLSGMAPSSAHAGHIHRGSCSGAIILPLSVITADTSGEGTMTVTVNAPIDASSWWIQYHTSDNPPGPPIACGQVVLASQ